MAYLASFGAFGGIGAIIVLAMAGLCWIEDHCYDDKGRLQWPTS